MWATVLMLALFMATNDPARLIIASFLATRERPLPNLIAYWIGGVGGGIVTSVVVIVFLHDSAAKILHSVTSTAADLTAGYVRIALGVIALLFAVRIGSRMLQRQPVGVPMDAVSPSPVVLQPSITVLGQVRTALHRLTPPIVLRFSAKVWLLLESGSPRVSFVAGIMSAMPPFEHQAALTTIMASGAGIGEQLCASIMFVLVVMATLEVVLVSYLLTPTKTQRFIRRLQDWLRVIGKKTLPVMAGAAGVMLVFSGLGGI